MIRKFHTSAYLLACVLLSAFAFTQQRPELTGNPGTIPSGTVLNVRIIDSLSSDTSQTGDVFHGTLQDDIEANGKMILPRGSDVTGRVTSVTPSGRLSASGVLELSITSINANNVAAKIVTEPLKIQGESHTKSNATKIGAGAAAGAIIGAIAGGGKGAAIGTIAGGAAGTGAAAATGKKEAKVEPEAVLSWTTSVSILASAVKPGSINADGNPTGSNDEPRLKRRSPSGEPVPIDLNAQSNTTQTAGAQSTTAPSGPTTAQPTAPTTSTSHPMAPAAPMPSTEAAAASTRAANPVPATAASPGTSAAGEFSARDRRVLRTCLTGDTGELPAGLAQKQPLPAGSEQRIRKNAQLPYELSKRAQVLPLACENQLPKLPSNVERVILNRQVLLLNTQGTVLDLYNLDE